MDINLYVQNFYTNHILKPKVTKFLDHLTLYTCNGVVYKVMYVIDDNYKSKLSKMGIKEHYNYIEDFPKQKIIMDEFDLSFGYYIIHYSFKEHNFKVYEGEF